jgi:hypothetical protein
LDEAGAIVADAGKGAGERVGGVTLGIASPALASEFNELSLDFSGIAAGLEA